MYIYILHACLGVYRCRSVGHFPHRTRVRVPRWVFLFSLRRSVPWEKKKGFSLDGRCGLLRLPLPRTSSSTYATPCLPQDKKEDLLWCVAPPPQREETPVRLKQQQQGWGGRCLLSRTFGERPAGDVSRVLMSHSIIYFESPALPNRVHLRVCVCSCMCAWMCVCVCIAGSLRLLRERGGLVFFSKLGGPQFFFLVSSSFSAGAEGPFSCC